LFLEKAGTAIFLMKEKAKLVKEKKERTTFTLSKRLFVEEEKQGEPSYNSQGADKRMRVDDGSARIIPASSQGSTEPIKKK